MPFEASDTQMSLVADIGGTNTRVALAHGPRIEMTSVRRYGNAGQSGIDTVLRQYLIETGTSEDLITGVCVAAAGPVHNGVAQMTNLPWRIERDAIARALTAERAAVLNDLQAQGHAIGHIAGTDLQTVIAQPTPPDNAAKLVVGIGTGFNASPVFEAPSGRIVPPAEAGHVSLPICDDKLGPVIDDMRRRFNFASVEEVLSGRGISYLHEALHGEALMTPVVMERLADGDAQATETARLFVRVMGTVIGDLSLVHLPFGGIYLVGGVSRAVAPYLERFEFAAALRDKGRFAGFMEQFGVHVVSDDYAALTGCAAHLETL